MWQKANGGFQPWRRKSKIEHLHLVPVTSKFSCLSVFLWRSDTNCVPASWSHTFKVDGGKSFAMRLSGDEGERPIEWSLIISVITIIIATVNRGDNSKACYINNVDPPQSTGMGNITLRM